MFISFHPCLYSVGPGIAHHNSPAFESSDQSPQEAIVSIPLQHVVCKYFEFLYTTTV